MKEKKDKAKELNAIESDEKEKRSKKGNGEYLKNLMASENISPGLIAEELLNEIELLKKEIDDFKKAENEHVDRIKRIQADYDNYRKRTLKEQIDLIKRANKDLIEKMLPVLDSFESALEIAYKTEKAEDEFTKGIEMIYSKLLEVLEKEGLKVINPGGEEFDPKICEAAVTETSSDFEDHHIISVLRKGYILGDFVIRPAVVKVCIKN